MTEVSQNLRFAASKRTDGRQGTFPLQKPSASNTDSKPNLLATCQTAYQKHAAEMQNLIL